MSEVNELIDLLQNKKELTALVAPSFAVMYSACEIISLLKKLGFAHIMEVSAGARRTNAAVLKVLQENPQSRFITSPCPSFVRFIRTKHPEFLPYLAFQADSPMIATAKIARELFPQGKPVFIGPCNVKKLEAKEDYPELGINVITYRELESILEHFGIHFTPYLEKEQQFDVKEESTRIYPFDGGLTDSSGVRSILNNDQIRVVSGWKNCESALHEFQENHTIRFMDILFCEGGCINGPGIKSTLSLDERKKRVIDYTYSH
jgi:iron only hydrogenase large subunit-like protein